MAERIQIRLISLLEEAANSFEQLETLANRTLREIPPDKVEAIEFRPIERDVVEQSEDAVSEMDQLVHIRYRCDVDPL